MLKWLGQGGVLFHLNGDISAKTGSWKIDASVGENMWALFHLLVTRPETQSLQIAPLIFIFPKASFQRNGILQYRYLNLGDPFSMTMKSEAYFVNHHTACQIATKAKLFLPPLKLSEARNDGEFT